MKKVLYFNNIFPLYRESIWKLLLNETQYDFNIFYSDQVLNNIQPYKPRPDEFPNKLNILKNYFFFGTLIWQSKVINKIVKGDFDIAIFMGNMSIISTWIGAIICRFYKKKVFFWTHGLYGNESFIKKKIRILFLRLANKNILYEDRAKEMLIKEGFNKNILKLYNSLNYDLQLKFLKN